MNPIDIYRHGTIDEPEIDRAYRAILGCRHARETAEIAAYLQQQIRTLTARRDKRVLLWVAYWLMRTDVVLSVNLCWGDRRVIDAAIMRIITD